MFNTTVALDILLTALQISSRIQAMLTRAQTENRDVTDDELKFLKSRNDELEQKILNSGNQ